MIHRVVFDTNILISALLSLRGAPFRCVALARLGVVQSVTCEQILDEFAEKLRTKFGFDEEHVQQAVHEIRTCSQVVFVPGALRAIPEDPDDDVVLECALNGNAEIVVSGDRHLRSLGHYESIRILSANEFLSVALE
ncbi:MAG: putative toxin-antitoxin system toxin component, PIN family [Caldilineae bacterium]|nr:MAG: putative toxin-antitoxin system toxin component, PIN family [Caldilineae bacterium]